MIKSFGDKQTQMLFMGRRVKKFVNFERQALRRLEFLEAADSLEDLQNFKSNRLHRLTGKLKDYWSISINDQFRIIFKWIDQNAYDVQIVDYH